MKKIDWHVKFGVGLVLLSVVLYSLHYVIFHDAHHLFIFMLGELAFLPLEVFIVGLGLEKIMEKREKAHLIEKLNMIIGVFFTEVGTELLEKLTLCDNKMCKFKTNLKITKEWSDRDFKEALEVTKNYNFEIDFDVKDLQEIKRFLCSKRDFLLKLLENPNILEHDSFTYFLTAVFHLEEELNFRDISNLSLEEKEHIKEDIIRVYSSIIGQWILYMKHLKDNFPFLFNSALLTNPFTR
ncbi:hypothetical protein [Oceanirhabdus sp. W0125-5]|uniref:hypothetical protein n=1 Tax=Oceanirhabdus sp. W0125-5 TaxID=2999116 RepID=UPI0022F30EF3|nr:hypothetical protein [Oceanirhabdus sp. W0125-5]WBW98413.1 hypothetical protein OW730_06500 [Oceanirhabdus sp. W0125-5]